MRRGRDGVRFVWAGLALGLGVTLASAGEPADAKPGGSAWGWWPGWGQAEAREKPDEAPAPEPAAVPVRVKQVEREKYHETVFLRRDSVCDELIAVALQTGDQELEREAEKLRDRAFAIWLERTGMKKGTLGGQFPEAVPVAGGEAGRLREGGE
jgi:hypothetical protein